MAEYDDKYFESRGLEQKHYLQTMIWISHFNLNSNTFVLDYGSGRGPYVHALRYYEIPAFGIDIAESAVRNPIGFANGNIFLENELQFRTYDLVICYDVMEHIEENQLNSFIENLKRYCKKYLLCSICFFNDPNWQLDKTHKIMKSRFWWIKKIEDYGFRLLETPKDFMFKEQILIFELNPLLIPEKKS